MRKFLLLHQNEFKSRETTHTHIHFLNRVEAMEDLPKEFLASPLCPASTITLLGCTIFQFMAFHSILMVVLLAHVEDIDYLLFQ